MPQTRRELFFRLADRLAPDGVLFVGSSECLTGSGPSIPPATLLSSDLLYAADAGAAVSQVGLCERLSLQEMNV